MDIRSKSEQDVHVALRPQILREFRGRVPASDDWPAYHFHVIVTRAGSSKNQEPPKPAGRLRLFGGLFDYAVGEEVDLSDIADGIHGRATVTNRWGGIAEQLTGGNYDFSFDPEQVTFA